MYVAANIALRMSLLEVSEIGKQEDGLYVLKDISFTQNEYQKIAIAGATGSGKTTLLKIIAGLVQPDKGTVLFEGEKVKGPNEKLIPGHPSIAYLSQHFELHNHYRVEELVEMVSQLNEEETKLVCEACRISHLLKRWSHQLSGGERQRISLARALVTSPKLLVLDEPYSNLDAIHKNILKSVIQEISETLDTTCLIVSHEPIDVLSWADDIIILQEGSMIQKGSPHEVYNQPVSEYAAALFGRYNVLTPSLAKAFAAFADIEMNRINSFIRPEQFSISHREDEGVKGEIKETHFMGSYYQLSIQISGHQLIANTNVNGWKKGDVVYASLGA